MKKLLLALLALASTAQAHAQQLTQLQLGQKTLHSMQGCYLVDFSYSETESLKPGYVIDERVYDVNRNMSVKEWIYADDITPTRTHLQHVLFAVGLDGKVMEGSQLKHTGEDWEFETPYLYDFTSPNNWAVKTGLQAGTWTRKITNLDDGLRYQCAAAFKQTTAYPEWTCAGYAPIPGRETRDMGRKDYDTLDRVTRVIAYGNSWLERQDNVKTIDKGQGRTPLARETGKNWYVHLPDSECEAARAFVEPRHDFWQLTREAWDQVLVGDRPFVEKVAAPGTPSRYWKMSELEEDVLTQKADLTNPSVRAQVIAKVRQLIQDFRAN